MLPTDDSRLLVEIIREHNDCSLLTSKVSNYFKYVIGIVYYGAVPGLNIALLVVISDKATLFLRIVSSFLWLKIAYLVFYHNWVGCHVQRAAHSPYGLLNTVIARNSIDIRIRLKLMSYIEKLSFTTIGIYCFDFFPITNYEFYLLVTHCVKVFLLVTELF